MLTTVAPIFIGFLVTMTLMLALRPIASQFGLVDVPGGRKNHSGEVPIIGGIAMFAGATGRRPSGQRCRGPARRLCWSRPP